MYAVGEFVENLRSEKLIQYVIDDLPTSLVLTIGGGGLLKIVALKGVLGSLGSTGVFTLETVPFIAPLVVGGIAVSVARSVLEAVVVYDQLLKVYVAMMVSTVTSPLLYTIIGGLGMTA